MRKANPKVPSKKRKNKIFNTIPIVFQYLSFSLLTKLAMLIISPKKQLNSVTIINDLGIAGKPSSTFIVVGTELKSTIIKIRFISEKQIATFENKFLDAVSFISVSIIILCIQATVK